MIVPPWKYEAFSLDFSVDLASKLGELKGRLSSIVLV